MGTIAKLQEEAEAAMKSAEDLAEKGDITASKRMTTRATELTKEIVSVKDAHGIASKGDLVCMVCGIRCNMDEDNAYDAHCNSNLHNAYKKIREACATLKENLKNEPRVDVSS